ncbi:MAG: PIN domain-containing protein [Promethearchaeota archaeon]
MLCNIVVIDANFIFLPIQFKINFLSEINDILVGKNYFLIYKQIFDELESKKKRLHEISKFGRELTFAKMYLESNKNNYNLIYIKKIKQRSETTDQFLLNECLRLNKKHPNIFLATNDSQLRKEASKANIRNVYLRQKKYLAIS